MPTAPKLLLLDAASMYFRAFHGVPESVVAPDGTPIGAVRGFVDAIARMLKDHPATELIACFDEDWRPQWRVDLLPSYKAHRVAEETPAGSAEVIPDSLEAQVPIIESVLDAIGLARVGVPDFEADDVIGTLAHIATQSVDIVTGDRDLFQLIDDASEVTVLYIGRGFAKTERLHDADVQRRYGVPAASYADFAALRGDPSDGLPGVRGVGDKSAAGVIAKYPTMESLLEALEDEEATVPFAGKLLADRDYLARAIEVVRVRLDVPIPPLKTEIPRLPEDEQALNELVERWGIGSPVQRLLDVLSSM